jgi:hypothetical protein
MTKQEIISGINNLAKSQGSWQRFREELTEQDAETLYNDFNSEYPEGDFVEFVVWIES